MSPLEIVLLVGIILTVLYAATYLFDGLAKYRKKFLGAVLVAVSGLAAYFFFWKRNTDHKDATLSRDLRDNKDQLESTLKKNQDEFDEKINGPIDVGDLIDRSNDLVDIFGGTTDTDKER